MRVNQAEEAAIDSALLLIEDYIQQYKKKYNVNDDTSLAIMCCIKLAVDYMEQKSESRDVEKMLTRRLQALNDSLENTLRSSTIQPPS